MKIKMIFDLYDSCPLSIVIFIRYKSFLRSFDKTFSSYWIKSIVLHVIRTFFSESISTSSHSKATFYNNYNVFFFSHSRYMFVWKWLDRGLGNLKMFSIHFANNILIKQYWKHSYSYKLSHLLLLIFWDWIINKVQFRKF